MIEYHKPFPEYEFREYPKWIDTGKDEQGEPTGIIVRDEDEELQVLDTQKAPLREADERARLIAVADVKGVQVDKRWSASRLSDAISAAGHDPSLDPSQ